MNLIESDHGNVQGLAGISDHVVHGYQALPFDTPCDVDRVGVGATMVEKVFGKEYLRVIHLLGRCATESDEPALNVRRAEFAPKAGRSPFERAKQDGTSRQKTKTPMEAGVRIYFN